MGIVAQGTYYDLQAKANSAQLTPNKFVYILTTTFVIVGIPCVGVVTTTPTKISPSDYLK